jgi:ferrous iron transport protein A
MVAVAPLAPLETRSLREHPIGLWGRIGALAVSAAEQSWLAALGLTAGDGVLVVRRALFGGPLHIRTASGGEFAVDSSLAMQITVAVEPDAAR